MYRLLTVDTSADSLWQPSKLLFAGLLWPGRVSYPGGAAFVKRVRFGHAFQAGHGGVAAAGVRPRLEAVKHLRIINSLNSRQVKIHECASNGELYRKQLIRFLID
jgi:hypothetical protein